MKLMIITHLASKTIIESKIFDNATISVILANSMVMTLESG